MTVAFIVLLFFANLIFIILMHDSDLFAENVQVSFLLFQILFVLTLILAELVTQQLYDESVFWFLKNSFFWR